MFTGPMPMLVTAEITFDLVIDIDRGMPVRCVLGYSAADPFCVTAQFSTGEADVRWVFARELLEGGLHSPTGHGDVVCWPARRGVEELVSLSLRSPSGQARLETPAPAIRDFLQRTYDLVPPGAESDHANIDGLISSLLSEV